MKKIIVFICLSFLLFTSISCDSNSNLSGMSDGEGLDYFLSRIRLNIENQGGYISNNIFVKTVYSKENQFKSLTASSIYAHFSTDSFDRIDTLGFHNSNGLWETYFTKDETFMRMSTDNNTRYIDYSTKPDYEIIAGNEKNVLRYPSELGAKKVKFNGLSRFEASLNKDELQESDWLYNIQIPFMYLYSYIDNFKDFRFKAEFTFEPHGIYNPNYVLQLYCEWRFPLDAEYNYELHIYSMTTNYYLSESGSLDPTLTNPNQQDIVAINPIYITRFRNAGEYVRYNASIVQDCYFGFFFEPGIYELINMNIENPFSYQLYNSQKELQFIDNHTMNVYTRGYYYLKVTDYIEPTLYYGWFQKLNP